MEKRSVELLAGTFSPGGSSDGKRPTKKKTTYLRGKKFSGGGKTGGSGTPRGGPHRGELPSNEQLGFEQPQRVEEGDVTVGTKDGLVQRGATNGLKGRWSEEDGSKKLSGCVERRKTRVGKIRTAGAKRC